MTKKLLGLVLVSLVVSVPAWAHHSFTAQFDSKKPVTLKGTVTKMDWINPHAWIHMEVKGPDGKTEEWMVETGTPNILLRRGFTKKALEAGTEIVVKGYMAKSGENKINGGSVTFSDGKQLFLGGSNPDQPSEP
jgi:hypothetical protein